MLPSLGEVLAMEVCRRGRPAVVAGDDRLDTPVRWVHAIELTDVARLLRGGELVLSTGIALPDDDRLLTAYVTELADVGVAGLAVELGRRYAGSLPGALVAAAKQAGLPLIAFEREVAFIEITEAVHARIIDAQLDELRVSERLHEMFTELSVAGASPEEIVRQAAALAGRPVILADLSHRVLACEPAGADPGRLLSGFAARSRSVRLSGRTAFDEASGWLVTPVGAQGEDWGRVILVCDGPPSSTDTVLHRAGGHHAGARPAAHPAPGEPRAAGPPDADQRHHLPGARRSGRGRGAVPGAGSAGRRAPAHRAGAAVPRSGGFRSAGRGIVRRTPGCWTWPTRRPPRAGPSGSPRWSARWTTTAPGPCSRSARGSSPTTC